MDMARNEVGGKTCPDCGSSGLSCKYNLFESGDLRIDSWEHKCPDCGRRQTQAFRSDDEDSDAVELDPTACPFCGRQATG